MQVGMIGLGRMGLPMLERLCQKGWKVCCYARKPDVISQVTQLGAQVCESAQAVAQKADLLIICVYSDHQVQNLMLGDAGIASAVKVASVVVIHTTGSPATSESVAAALADRGVRVIDAPVSGGPHNIQAGNITLLVGGDAAALEYSRPVLSAYANPILHIGSVGAGQKTKLLNNALFGAQIALLTEIDRLMAAFDLPAETVLEAITHCSGDSAALRLANRSGSVSRLLESAGAFVEKDRAVVAGVAAELGVTLGGLAIEPLSSV